MSAKGELREPGNLPIRQRWARLLFPLTAAALDRAASPLAKPSSTLVEYSTPVEYWLRREGRVLWRRWPK